MKPRTASALVAGIAALFALALAPALLADDNHPCSTRHIAGKWGFSLTGQGDGAPTLAAGTITFDRSGNVAGTSTFNVAGDVMDIPFSGTISVNADCTGHMSLPDIPIEYDVVVIQNSNEILFISRDPVLVFAVDAKRLTSGGD